MFSGIATIFNQYEKSDGTIVWFPHVLQNLHLETDMETILKKTGNAGGDKGSLHIPYTGEKVITDADGNELKWFPSKAWAAQDEDELPNTITFAADDFFMVGAWDGDSPVNDADYTDRRNEGFFAYMNASFDDVYKITSAQAYNVIPHFEVMAGTSSYRGVR